MTMTMLVDNFATKGKLPYYELNEYSDRLNYGVPTRMQVFLPIRKRNVQQVLQNL